MKFEDRLYLPGFCSTFVSLKIDFKSLTILCFFFVVNILTLATFVSSIRLHLEISYQRSKIDQPTKREQTAFEAKYSFFTL